MTRTFLIALVCAVGAVSMAQAQSGGSSGGSSSGGTSGGTTGGTTGGTSTTPGGVGNQGTHGTSSGTAPGGTTGGGSVVTPRPGSGTGTNQPAIDTNQAQQPGVGVNRGQSNNGSVAPPSK